MGMFSWKVLGRDATLPPQKKTLPAPHRTTGSQIITGSYQMTTAHYRQITSIYMAFTIKDVYRYQQFIDKTDLFTAAYRR